jgi:hypothetical protein
MCLGVVSYATEPHNFRDLAHSNLRVNIGYRFDSNETTKMWCGVFNLSLYRDSSAGRQLYLGVVSRATGTSDF